MVAQVIVKCTKCNHEWQAVESDFKHRWAVEGELKHRWHEPYLCDWCGAPGEKIASDYMDEP